MVTLGERISYYRKNANITQAELAYRLGVTSQAISKWERNQSYPDINTFAELCRNLQISADVLLETEYLFQSYHRVLHREALETVNEETMDKIFSRLKETVKKHYGYILNEDIVKMMVDNLRIKYPALISNVIPEIIPYSTLRIVMAGLVEHGVRLCYMTKIIEVLEAALRNNPKEDIQGLVEKVAKEIEREDDYWVMQATGK